MAGVITVKRIWRAEDGEVRRGSEPRSNPKDSGST